MNDRAVRLRAKAEAIPRRAGYQSRIDRLLERLNPDDREAVLDLLTGEPLIPHVNVALVLADEFGDLLDCDLVGRHVLDWRHRRGIRVRPPSAP